MRDLGNTLIVVEHDEDTMRAADYIVDVGPRAGVHGGEIVAEMSEKNRDRPFAELWTDSLAMLRLDSALSLEVLADVDRLGKIMGDMDVEAQLSRINLVEDIITDRYQRERARSSGIKRLANSLGLLGGVFIVILLM